MISFDEATAIVASVARPSRREPVALEQAHRRVLAEPVISRVSAPPADASAMDGYAVCDADLASLPARLPVSGEVYAGCGLPPPLQPGSCVRIFTGAPVPSGADRVVVQEIVRREGELALFEEAPGAGRHIRKAGSDFREGDVLLDAGTRLGPRQLVAVAAADLDRVTAWARPRLMVLATGDELAEPGSAAARSGAIPESVSFGVAALAEEWGAQSLGSVRLTDRLDELEEAARLATRDADIVVVTGGASVGERDFARAMFAAQDLELLFSKVAIKPGKPVWLGRAGGRLVLGLPGNPSSAMVTARLFLAPLLAGMSGRAPASALDWRSIALALPAASPGARETFARASREGGDVRIASNQDSSAQMTLGRCDSLVRLRAGIPPLDAGAMVDVLDF